MATTNEIARKIYIEILKYTENEFEDSFIGAFPCLEKFYDYVYYHDIEDSGAPKHLIPYINVERFADDLLRFDYISYEVTGEEGPDFEEFTGYIFIFWR